MLLEESRWSEQKAFQAATFLSQQEQINMKGATPRICLSRYRYPGVCSLWHGKVLCHRFPVQRPRTSVPLRCGRSPGPLRRGHLRRAACDVYFFMTENCKNSWACPFSPTTSAHPPPPPPPPPPPCLQSSVTSPITCPLSPIVSRAPLCLLVKERKEEESWLLPTLEVAIALFPPT